MCDAFDAMVADRPYRAGMDAADALVELERCSGSQFDPARRGGLRRGLGRAAGPARRCVESRAVRAHWLKGIGHARASLPEAWLADGRASVLERTGFPRRPRMAPGDRLVYYAAGWRWVFAVVEVVSEPTDTVAHTSNPARWPWSVAVEALLVVPHLENAPPVEAIGVAARSMSQQSHIRLSEEHYERAVEAIAGVAA